MRRNIPSFFAILLLCTLILCSACTSGTGTSAPEPAGQNSSGLVQVTSTLSPGMSFDTALQKLRTTRSDGPAENTLRIYLILAKDFDDKGDAASWFFGINDGSGPKLIIFDRLGRTEMPLGEASVPSEEIKFSSVVLPAGIITENRNIIFKDAAAASGQNELELRDGVYTLTVAGTGGSRIMKFNATTGALIQ